MELVGINCEVMVTDVDEPITDDAENLVRELSMKKNQAACDAVLANMEEHEDTIIIAADTLVSIEGKVLEKPSSREEAFKMLKMLSGNKHTVYTGVNITKLAKRNTMLNPRQKFAAQTFAIPLERGLATPRFANDLIGVAMDSRFVESADVFFRELTDDEINAYIDTGEPFDKAGAYGVQEKGALLVEKVHGDFYTVVGLPIMRVGYVLGQMGVDIWKT